MKLGDFGLSKALAQTSFANTYVGVCFHPLYAVLYVTQAISDTILHVSGAHARESVRLKVGRLVARLPYL